MPAAKMDWPWHINTRIPLDEKLERRVLLDRYGVYAQLSALIPVAVYWLYRLGVWVFHARQRVKPWYSAIPGSPLQKEFRATKTGKVATKLRAFRFWLGGYGWGGEKRVHQLAGLAWLAWLLFLSVHRTGDDYFHVTKRFGIVAMSQFPLHYMLIMKHRYSPLGILFRASHEQLNPYHRALGGVIYTLLLLHSTFYLNYFIRAGLVISKLLTVIPLLGMISFCLMNLLTTTSLRPIRNWSYRLFFVLHLTIALALIPLLFFHAAPLRPYILEALLLFLLDLATRRLTTFTSPTAIAALPSTTLLTLTIPIPPTARPRFAPAAGHHIYLSLPRPSQPAHAPILSLCFNPFTITAAAPDGSAITLVVRARAGPTSAALTALLALPKADPPLLIDGPYGNWHRFPDFATGCDRVLLLAGGVGAAFVLPMYRRARRELEEAGVDAKRLRVVWAVRAEAEAAWAAEELEGDGVELFVTGEEEVVADAGVGLEELAARGSEDGALKGRGRRPEVGQIVDEVFRMGEGERVAVVVCGPAGMAAEARRGVARWVGRGREVWFHEEGFGF